MFIETAAPGKPGAATNPGRAATGCSTNPRFLPYEIRRVPSGRRLSAMWGVWATAVVVVPPVRLVLNRGRVSATDGAVCCVGPLAGRPSTAGWRWAGVPFVAGADLAGAGPLLAWGAGRLGLRWPAWRRCGTADAGGGPAHRRRRDPNGEPLRVQQSWRVEQQEHPGDFGDDRLGD